MFSTTIPASDSKLDIQPCQARPGCGARVSTKSQQVLPGHVELVWILPFVFGARMLRVD